MAFSSHKRFDAHFPLNRVRYDAIVLFTAFFKSYAEALTYSYCAFARKSRESRGTDMCVSNFYLKD